MKLQVVKNCLLEEGLNVVFVSDIEDGGQTTLYNGRTEDTVYVKFIEPISGNEKRNRYVATVSDRSHLGKLVKAILGQIPNDLDSEDLIGEKLVVKIAHKEKDGNVYDNIVDVQSINSTDSQQLVNPEALKKDYKSCTSNSYGIVKPGSKPSTDDLDGLIDDLMGS